MWTSILADLGVREGVPQLEVWNKIDLLPEDEPRRTVAARRDSVVAVSALTGQGLEALVEAISTALGESRSQDVVEIGHEQGRARAWAYEEGIVRSESPTDDGTLLDVSWSPRQRRQFEALLIGPD